jgi:hypothetical protein
MKSGSYASSVTEDGRSGSIVAGDLYADEARDFLVYVDVDRVVDKGCEEEQKEEVVTLLKVGYGYEDPVRAMSSADGKLEEEVKVGVRRPWEGAVEATMSAEVEREKERLRAAQAMAEARVAAERDDLPLASGILKLCRGSLSMSRRAGDSFSRELRNELKEMMRGTATNESYGAWGRALMGAGMSSHMQQRATYGRIPSGARRYRTAAMEDMLQQSRDVERQPDASNQ